MYTKEEKSGKSKGYMTYYIIGAIILILIIVYFSFFRLDIKIKSDKILRCEDGTAYDSCSTNKPFYCSNGILVSSSTTCGCSNGLIAAGNECKDAKELLPDSNFTCKELVPQELSVRFSASGYAVELEDMSNSLTNNIPLKNVLGEYCYSHPPAKAGENIAVENLFYCYGYSNAGGEADYMGIVKRAYKISYEFVMDKRICINSSSFETGSFRKCNVNSVNCSWTFTN